MKLKTLLTGSMLAMVAMAGSAIAGPSCGANTGKAATGAPIKVGGIYGNAAPGDFSASTTAAKAYFELLQKLKQNRQGFAD